MQVERFLSALILLVVFGAAIWFWANERFGITEKRREAERRRLASMVGDANARWACRILEPLGHPEIQRFADTGSITRDLVVFMANLDHYRVVSYAICRPTSVLRRQWFFDRQIKAEFGAAADHLYAYVSVRGPRPAPGDWRTAA